MKKIIAIIALMMIIPLTGCHVSGSIGESSSNVESMTHIC